MIAKGQRLAATCVYGHVRGHKLQTKYHSLYFSLPSHRGNKSLSTYESKVPNKWESEASWHWNFLTERALLEEKVHGEGAVQGGPYILVVTAFLLRSGERSLHLLQPVSRALQIVATAPTAVVASIVTVAFENGFRGLHFELGLHLPVPREPSPDSRTTIGQRLPTGIGDLLVEVPLVALVPVPLDPLLALLRAVPADTSGQGARGAFLRVDHPLKVAGAVDPADGLGLVEVEVVAGGGGGGVGNVGAVRDEGAGAAAPVHEAVVRGGERRGGGEGSLGVEEGRVVERTGGRAADGGEEVEVGIPVGAAATVGEVEHGGGELGSWNED